MEDDSDKLKLVVVSDRPGDSSTTPEPMLAGRSLSKSVKNLPSPDRPGKNA